MLQGFAVLPWKSGVFKEEFKMKLLFFSDEQECIRVFDCEYECWEDMKHILYTPENFKERKTSLSLIMSYGWELVGEL